jgi:hypothetical protein
MSSPPEEFYIVSSTPPGESCNEWHDRHVNKSYHSLIYGASMEDLDLPKLMVSSVDYVPRTDGKINIPNTDGIDPTHIYTLPRCGTEHNFVGFEYARVNQLYDRLRTTKTGIINLVPEIKQKERSWILLYVNLALECDYPILESLSLSMGHRSKQPSNEIKKKFAETYPGIEGRCFALIQNVYAFHYAEGVIAYGYWIDPISSKIFYSENDMPTNYINCEAWQVGHTMICPSKHFYGIKIEDLRPIDPDDPAEYANELAHNLSQIYTVDEVSQKIPSKKNIEEYLRNDYNMPDLYLMGDTPILAVLVLFCHCCT